MFQTTLQNQTRRRVAERKRALGRIGAKLQSSGNHDDWGRAHHHRFVFKTFYETFMLELFYLLLFRWQKNKFF